MSEYAEYKIVKKALGTNQAALEALEKLQSKIIVSGSREIMLWGFLHSFTTPAFAESMGGPEQYTVEKMRMAAVILEQVLGPFPAKFFEGLFIGPDWQKQVVRHLLEVTAEIEQQAAVVEIERKAGN